MRIAFDPSFKRAYRKRIAPSEKLQKKFEELLPVFISHPFDARLKTHKLSGRLQGLYSFSVDYDTRVVFYFEGEDKAVFIDVGTHDEVY
jgi:addiction module RelE/StbE family toxin